MCVETYEYAQKFHPIYYSCNAAKSMPQYAYEYFYFKFRDFNVTLPKQILRFDTQFFLSQRYSHTYKPAYIHRLHTY